MQPRVDLITLGVLDVGIAREFYANGLGWAPIFEVPGDIVFLQIGHGRVLGLFGREDLERDACEPGATSEPADGAVSAPMSLAQVVATEDEVVATLARAEAAGARILKSPQPADFGGFHGYFADPSGFRWEIATNPGWKVEADGTVVIGPVAG